MIKITPAICIDEKKIEERFIHASGHGGQNVNKVATAVQLRFDLYHAGLPEEVCTRLLKLAGKRLSSEGILIIEAKRFRTQLRNREDAMEKLITLIRLATKTPKSRKKTKPTIASKRRRLENKQQRSKIKSSRTKIQRNEM
jgi:ribosome-associated protein